MTLNLFFETSVVTHEQIDIKQEQCIHSVIQELI